MTQPAAAAQGAVTDHFDHGSLEVLRPRAAGLDVHKMRITATVRLCEPGMPRPLRATREFSALPPGLRELTGWLLGLPSPRPPWRAPASSGRRPSRP